MRVRRRIGISEEWAMDMNVQDVCIPLFVIYYLGHWD
jgi:hypothetical protein